jgi:hypothetical protein
MTKGVRSNLLNYFCQVLAVSTIVNQSILRPYVFRNYRHRHELKSHYPGSCSHKLWEALRASSAAPGYFEEFKLGRDIHQVRKPWDVPYCTSRKNSLELIELSSMDDHL